MIKVFDFSIPVKGLENFSVLAENYEEAIEKIHKCEYFVEPTLDDIDWDFGFRHSGEELERCYTISDYKGETK